MLQMQFSFSHYSDQPVVAIKQLIQKLDLQSFALKSIFKSTQEKKIDTLKQILQRGKVF